MKRTQPMKSRKVTEISPQPTGLITEVESILYLANLTILDKINAIKVIFNLYLRGKLR